MTYDTLSRSRISHRFPGPWTNINANEGKMTGSDLPEIMKQVVSEATPLDVTMEKVRNLVRGAGAEVLSTVYDAKGVTIMACVTWDEEHDPEEVYLGVSIGCRESFLDSCEKTAPNRFLDAFCARVFPGSNAKMLGDDSNSEYTALEYEIEGVPVTVWMV